MSEREKEALCFGLFAIAFLPYSIVVSSSPFWITAWGSVAIAFAARAAYIEHREAKKHDR